MPDQKVVWIELSTPVTLSETTSNFFLHASSALVRVPLKSNLGISCSALWHAWVSLMKDKPTLARIWLLIGKSNWTKAPPGTGGPSMVEVWVFRFLKLVLARVF